MNEFNFSVPQNIIVGRGSMAKLPEVAKKMGGKHAFIISGPHLKKMGLVEKAAESLRAEGILVDDFTDIEGNPSVTTVEAATEAFQASGADFIVAFGGGSPMDVAKAVGVVAKYGGSITEYEGAHKVPGKIIPLVALPTTAGTGSEVTAFSVITDHSRDYKLTVFSYELLPAYAILDADLIQRHQPVWRQPAELMHLSMQKRRIFQLRLLHFPTPWQKKQWSSSEKISGDLWQTAPMWRRQRQ